MRYKENWSETHDRLARYWAGTLEGCCLAVTAPRAPLHGETCPPPKDLSQKWLNISWRIRSARAEFDRTHWGGDAFPNLWVDMGPGAVAGFLGAEPYLGEDCVWFEKKPMLASLRERKPLLLSEENPWWRLTRELTEACCADAQGDYHVSINDLGGTLDIAADFRGVQQMLFDLMDEPDAVETLLSELDAIWIQCFNENYRWIAKTMPGCSDWMNIWCPDTLYSVQCDMATMLSPAQYERFVLPSITKQVRTLAHSMYHLHMYDTKGLSDQLDIMLNIPELDGIAFIAEPIGEDASADHWLPYLRRIQAKGKKLILFGQTAQSAWKLLNRLSPVGLHIHAACQNEEESQALLRAARPYTHPGG